MTNLFTINWKDVLSALVIAVISAILSYLANLVDISNLNWHQVLGIVITTGASALLSFFGTTKKGNFAGAIPVR